MENRAYNEPFLQRLNRLQNNPPVEIIDTLLNSIDNYFNNEISLTIEDHNYQTNLLFLGVHAVALTISEAFYNIKGFQGFKLFLEKYIDGDIDNKKFSLIAKKIHNWRNNLAHQWLASSGHQIGYDYNMESGWESRNGVIFINPRIYCNQYIAAFRSNKGRIWNYSAFDDIELEAIKQRLLAKYIRN